MNETNQQLVDMMERVWRSIGELCDGLTEAEWKTPTDCPGWSVQDQVSHLAGSETGILGDPDPDHTPSDEALAHTRSEQGQRNEIVVDFRRPWAGAQVLSDFRAKTSRRVEFLRSRSDDDFAAEMQTPGRPGSHVRVHQHPHHGRLGSRAGHPPRPQPPRPLRQPGGGPRL